MDLRYALRAIVPAVAIAALVPWLVFCARTYPAHALYFDQTMYQYTGWCIRHGEKLYATVAVPDGPFITWLHALVQIFAGESDTAFRVADLVIQVAGALAIGAVLAVRRRRWWWASAILVLWLAQYFRYDWRWTAQREAYYALVGYLGMAVLLLAARRHGVAAIALAVTGGLLVGSQLFGKQIGVIFVALGLLPLVLERRKLVKYALLGVTLAIGLGFAALALTGSIRGFWFWYLEVPRTYRYLMGSADPIALLFAIDRHTTVGAALAIVVGGVCAWRGWMPRAYLGLAIAPLLFLAAMILQRKGHMYQAHPITAGTYLFFAVLAMHLVHTRVRVGTALTAMLVLDASVGLASSDWLDPEPITKVSQLGAAHVNHADLFAAARKLSEVTQPDDRVFVYGPAARILYEAKRRPAVPPFANFFLNVKRAAVIDLDPEQRERLEELQRSIARRSCPRLRTPPPAVVACDGADWSGGPGLVDAQEVCPQLAYVKVPEYYEVAVYGCWHLWIRADHLRR